MKDQATYPLPHAKNLQNRKIGAMQRDKGQRGEREFCRALSEHLGETLRQLGAARDGGPDVLLGEHWAVEVKRGETLHLETWWIQAQQQADKVGRWPALAYRPNRRPWRVRVPLDLVMFGERVWDGKESEREELTAEVTLAGFAVVVRETRE